jgi:hypothetical protein
VGSVGRGKKNPALACANAGQLLSGPPEGGEI